MSIAATRQRSPSVQSGALLAALGLVALAALVGSVFTASSVDTWYVGLEKPAWTPSGEVIGTVWSVLYVLMAVAAWLVWRKAGFARARVALTLFAVQLALNVGWSALFFGLRSPGLALAEIALLWLAVLATAVAFSRHDRVAAALLVPYLAWVLFAAFLNATVWRLNA